MIFEDRARAALLAVALALLAGCGGSDGDSKNPSRTSTSAKSAAGVQLGPAFGELTSLPGALASAPPWPANEAKLRQRLRVIGLEPLSEEGQVVHIHQHLDVYVEGKKVQVPANIGIGPQSEFISDLHTHDDSGVLHVESPTPRSFSLGQFFAVWGLPLSASCIGSLCEEAGRQLRAWVNGKPVDADPTRIVLEEHQQIVLAYGTPAQVPKPLPASYRFSE